ncbi:MAG: fatty-acid oxidation protein subunit alpha [Saprospiraceae bacterium]|nr:MAG: fatty-acid oxidation protein subunit alpha [Saprospiraceae bacterium]
MTHDPMTISLPDMDLFVDLGIERFVGAQKGNRKIAIEIKSFGRTDRINKFYEALGQVLVYRLALMKEKIEREVWLAIPQKARQSLFETIIVQEALSHFQLNLLIFDQLNKKIVQWERF